MPEMFIFAKYDNIIVPVVELLSMHLVLLEYPCKCRHVLYSYYSATDNNMFAFPGEDLMEQQDTLDQEIASQKSQSEKEVPIEDSPLHTEPKDNEDTYASQQGSILCDNQPE